MTEKLERKVRTVGFLIPVIDGEIWLAQRGTEPFKGFYGGIGGKAESKSSKVLYNEPHTVYKLGGHQEISIADKLAIEEGREIISETSIREFCEEIFSDKQFPADFKKEDIVDVYKLGFIVDVVPTTSDVDNECYFHIAHVNRRDFHPSKREVTDFKPIKNIPSRLIFPLTRITLNHLEYSLNPKKGPVLERLQPYVKDELYKQIRVWKKPDKKFTSMVWAYTDTKASLYYESFLHKTYRTIKREWTDFKIKLSLL